MFPFSTPWKRQKTQGFGLKWIKRNMFEVKNEVLTMGSPRNFTEKGEQ